MVDDEYADIRFDNNHLNDENSNINDNPSILIKTGSFLWLHSKVPKPSVQLKWRTILFLRFYLNTIHSNTVESNQWSKQL